MNLVKAIIPADKHVVKISEKTKLKTKIYEMN
jgi:hypothetical protein